MEVEMNVSSLCRHMSTANCFHMYENGRPGVVIGQIIAQFKEFVQEGN
jgi:hypothetical protein